MACQCWKPIPKMRPTTLSVSKLKDPSFRLWIGLALGVVGLYGVVSYVTSQRTREIGVRLALGAEAGAVRAMILRQGMSVIALGLVVGLIGAYALSRFMEALLFQVNAKDPVTFIVVAGVLATVSVFATWLPAARAAGTDPVRALRWE